MAGLHKAMGAVLRRRDGEENEKSFHETLNPLKSLKTANSFLL